MLKERVISWYVCPYLEMQQRQGPQRGGGGHCFAGFLPESLDVRQVGSDVLSALAVDCSKKHLSFVHKSLNDSTTPLKIKEKEFGLTKQFLFKIGELR